MRSTFLHTSISHRIAPGAKALAANQVPVRGLLMSLALWLMIWGGYNTGIQRLFGPNFPANALDLFHGIRALLPFMAAWLALITLLVRRSLPVRLFQGPLGMLALYNLVGIASSIVLSPDPLMAVYWAAQYSSVIIVFWAILANSNPLPHLSRLIVLNWTIIAVLTTGLMAFFLIQPGVISILGGGDFLGTARPYDGLAGIPVEKEMLGMMGTRSTGLGRYAGVAALIALARLWQGAKWFRSIWVLLFLFFLSVLIFSQARTAVLAFLIGALLILWLQSRSKILLILGVSIALFLLGLIGFYQASWIYLTLGTEEVVDIFLSRRAVTWQETWQLFLTSPLLGCGFYADRLFEIRGQHTHNAFLHALLQTGLMGTIPFVLAFAGAWIILFRLLKRPSILRPEKSLLVEIAGALAYLTVRTIAESTGAFYGSELFLLTPLFAYITILNQRKSSLNQITFK